MRAIIAVVAEIIHDNLDQCILYKCNSLPIVTSLQEPNIMYVKHPINAEYKPYCGSRPATTPYAIACGIVVRPTVKPAIKSCNRKLASYLGSHEIIGNFRVIVERPQPF